MPLVSTTQLIKLQSKVENIRNICILAHVDHGKTTLSDSLLASNGIISTKLAGKVRYLDSREDEQERGITMEASGISLYFNVLRKSLEGQESSDDYLINLIDAPGHVDFSSEVSTASRLCDGALVLVDVVEGVCTQTHAVLRQAWLENVQPVLVLNKIDRLITELKLTPQEAYIHLNKILEQVNAIMGTFFAGDIMEEETRRHEAEKEKLLQQGNEQIEVDNISAELSLEDRDDSKIYFTPDSGNVVFASAIDGWAFRVENFVQFYAAKLGMKENILRKVLWGDYYLEPKTKRLLQHKHLKGRQLKPLFVQLVLENIWSIYDSIIINNNREKIEKIVKTLNLKILPRDMRSKDTRNLLTTIFTQWLPLSSALPSPVVAQPVRLPKMLYPNTDMPEKPANENEKALFSCDFSDTAPIIAYVSKMFAIPSNMLPENRRRQLTAEELRERGKAHRERLRALNGQSEESVSETSSTTSTLTSPESLDESVEKIKVSSQTDEDGEVDQPKTTKETFVGFARLYSGTIRVGQKLYVLGPKYDPTFPDKFCSEITVENLYLMMGRELEALKEVPAGNVFGIGGLEGHILKNGTLSSTKDCKSLAGVSMESAPIVRVALEPAEPSEMGKLTEGLRLLNQADPCVEVLVQETGEHVILTAGEVHLERCLRDLRERFAKIEIQVSPPIVPFRETIVPVPDNQQIKEKDNAQRGLVTLSTTNKYCTIKVRAVPLPQNVTTFLGKNAITIKSILDERQQRNKIETQSIEDEEDTFKDVTIKGNRILEADEFLDQLEAEFNKASDKEIWKDIVDNIWAFGPKRVGPNLLINHVPNYKRKFSWRKYHQEVNDEVNEEVLSEDNSSKKYELSIRDFVEGIHTGFQLATKSGPLCAEPLMGVAYFLEDFTINTNDEDVDISEIRSKLGGQIITTMRDACNKGFLEWSSRLMLAMYSCDVQATTDTLGRVYGVISRRRGRITSEELKEGTTFFQIFALLPVVESFGFADEIRKRTSGAASPQLIFSGFEMLNEDPFWVPTTEEELEDLGEKSDRENLAKRYMETVRKRKGMFIDKKIVEHAEKQRTLKKK
ncbi:P-loop containing nucleoside triphosphate hydrolase protein [Rhizophagus irregularis]|uniref:Ribosome assembly protein 1 n=1 Tax=Rhizophagus irregularis TaxID=588596 RepID=A0A2N0QCQ3_9GLOM|nr:P-loop containing nucleoside triphosphate hydrolase protein [Rhizophagus irregularis]